MRAILANLAILFAAPVAAQTYEPALLEPQIVGAPTAMTPLNLGDDNTAKVDLGFEFTYWDQTFTSAWVSSNGFVSFQSPAHLCCDGRPLDQAQRNTIYGLWTDNVSYSGNPFYRRSEGSILFGWYATNEYGTGNQQTFEIDLSSAGSITFNFGNLSGMTYHNATVGITGPNADDNVQLFYGRDLSNLRNQSGRLSWTAPEPAPTLDCAVTPLDPACPPQMVAPVQIITSPMVETIHDAYAAEVVADQADAAVAAVPEPEQEIAVLDVPVTETSVTVQVAEAIAAERLTPDQVAALAAPVPVAETIAPAVSMLAVTQGSNGSAAFAAAFENIASTSSPSSVANTLEALNMTPAPAPAAAQSDTATNAMSAGQDGAMAEMAAVPGFAAYTQVSLQDRPDFYAIREIYRNRRLRDANFEMYRITQTNSAKWREMVDEQYR